MTKVVKIKQSDIENIVESIVSEQWDHEEEPIATDTDVEDPDGDEKQGSNQFMVAKSKDGKFAVINIKTGEVLGMK